MTNTSLKKVTFKVKNRKITGKRNSNFCILNFLWVNNQVIYKFA